ncbi:hypothetical protein IMG5_069620 [Ichthyophthirius multifiliis]|uniref:Transmembrane protein n=1 Tax=Ichthyophthirius multifiliis TaxID=5932 RepID=G0QPM1_ICHMU|nr:hypothetical protein IMG5_069620 [Ichthyophthirius multifiliis]EGR32821.1 hypothetical protein IMG5_069620 [Ichthyophthirius multifiliis]|eukprot:XP_004036807.1 hypothetical protein IMG5_069620 [Ichthyophthirius multifiliis]
MLNLFTKENYYKHIFMGFNFNCQLFSIYSLTLEQIRLFVFFLLLYFFLQDLSYLEIKRRFYTQQLIFFQQVALFIQQIQLILIIGKNQKKLLLLISVLNHILYGLEYL